MTDAKQLSHTVTNHQNQPVELYLPGGMVVLPPRGRLTIAPGDVSAPQLRVLVAGRVVELHAEEVPVRAAEQGSGSAPAEGDKANDQPEATHGNG